MFPSGEGGGRPRDGHNGQRDKRAPTITEGALFVNDLACKTLPVYFSGGRRGRGVATTTNLYFFLSKQEVRTQQGQPSQK